MTQFALFHFSRQWIRTVVTNAFYVESILILCVEKGAANEISRLLARLGASLSANDRCCWPRREVRRCSSDGQEDHRKRSARDAYRRIANLQSRHASRRICEPISSLTKRVFFSLSPHRVGYTTRARVTPLEAWNSSLTQ